jgi:hypothetical protein
MDAIRKFARWFRGQFRYMAYVIARKREQRAQRRDDHNIYPLW